MRQCGTLPAATAVVRNVDWPVAITAPLAAIADQSATALHRPAKVAWSGFG